MRQFIRTNIVLFFIFSLFVMYAGILIYRSSFVIDGTRYFSLFDDMMISMRYARNLSSGEGLVWNPGGERVEGITNPLWTIIMALFHLVPISVEWQSLPIQILGGLCVLLTGIYVIKIGQLWHFSYLGIVGSLCLTLFYYPLNNWSEVLGTEVSLLTLFLTAAVYYLLRAVKKRRLAFLPYILLAISTFVRIDALVPVFIIVGYSWWEWRDYFRKKLLAATGIIVAAVVIQEFWRIAYYKDVLPNTYYLKMTGYPLLLRMARGLYVLKDFMNWLLVIIPLFAFLLKRDKKTVLLLAIFTGQLIYSVYVGGDAWEFFGGSNRYVTPAMPLFFVALIASLEPFWAIFKRQKRLSSRVRKTIGIIIIFLIFLSFHLKNDTMLLQSMLLRPPQTVGENKQQVMMAQTVSRVTDEDAVIGVVWAGIIPYFAERTYIDSLGKSDKTIAQTPAHMPTSTQEGLKRYVLFYPGHMKWDTPYVLSKKPDMFIQFYPEDETPLLLNTYQQYYSKEGFLLTIRKDTDRVTRKDLIKISQTKAM